MSLQKRSEAYARHMDEVFREDARDYDLEYREYQYLQATQKNTKQQTQKDNVDKREERQQGI